MYPIQRKSETFECFNQFHRCAETQTGRNIQSMHFAESQKHENSPTTGKLKVLSSDNGEEYFQQPSKPI